MSDAALERIASANQVRRRFGSEADIEALTGISRRTLQSDRLSGNAKFPAYKVGGKVLYDLDEVEAIIRRSAFPNREKVANPDTRVESEVHA